MKQICAAHQCPYLTDSTWCPTHTQELLEIINRGIALCDRLLQERENNGRT